MGVFDTLFSSNKSSNDTSKVAPHTPTSSSPASTHHPVATHIFNTAHNDSNTVHDLYTIGQHMCGLRGCIPIQLHDRKHRFRSYKQCFTGVECITWLIQHKYVDTVSDGVQLCNRLIRHNVFVRLTGSSSELFTHNTNFYRFEPEYRPVAAYNSIDIQRLKLNTIDYRTVVDECINYGISVTSDSNGHKQKLSSSKRNTLNENVPTSSMLNRTAAKAQQPQPSTATSSPVKPALSRPKSLGHDDAVPLISSAYEQEQQLRQRRNDGGFTGAELCAHLCRTQACNNLRDALIIGNWLMYNRIIHYIGYDEQLAKQIAEHKHTIQQQTAKKSADKYSRNQEPVTLSSVPWLADDTSVHPQSAPDYIHQHHMQSRHQRSSQQNQTSSHQQQPTVQWPGVHRQDLPVPNGFKNDSVWYCMPTIARQRSQMNLYGKPVLAKPPETPPPTHKFTVSFDAAFYTLTKAYQKHLYDPSYTANWEFVQSFGDDTTAYDYDDADDLVTAVEFSKTGEYLAIGDKAGRVSIVQEAHSAGNGKQASTQPLEYQFCSEFQSHSPEFDTLKSAEIECKINCIEWCATTTTNNLSLLTANDKTIKLWKISTKNNPAARQQHRLQLQADQTDSSAPADDGNDDMPITAVRKADYSNAHGYNIHSVSACSDGQTFLSADDLRVNIWNVECSDTAYNIIDMKPADMTVIDELITVATYHPHECYTLLHGSSKGITNLCDLRTRSVLDKRASTVLQFRSTSAKKTYYTEITDSILDAKYSHCGNYILTRDYMHCRLWDVRHAAQPLHCSHVHPHLQSQYSQLLDNEAIFDQFQCDISPDSLNYVTGSYSHCFTLHSVVNNTTVTVKAKDDAREPCVVKEWVNNTDQPSSRRFSNAPPMSKQNSVSINAHASGQGNNMILHNSQNNNIHVNSVSVGQNNGGINIINNTNGVINISINNTSSNVDSRQPHKQLLHDNSVFDTPDRPGSAYNKQYGKTMNGGGSPMHGQAAKDYQQQYIVISDPTSLPGTVDSPNSFRSSYTPTGGNMSNNAVPRFDMPVQPNIYFNGKGPNYNKKMLKVAWHPRMNAVAVAGLYKLYLYQTKLAAEL